MNDLTTRESELVALGAALASNCVPCIQYHIPQARKAGLTDREIYAAIELADKVRQVPARKVLEAAQNLLPPAQVNTVDAGSAGLIGGCTGGTGHSKDTKKVVGADETIDCMAAVMSRMMPFCDQPIPSAGNCHASLNKSKVPDPKTGRECC